MLAAILALTALQISPQPPVPPSKSVQPCASTDHRALDFWVGEWDVYPAGTAKLVAHSLIEKLYAGCAIRENWMPLVGGPGGSLSSFDPADKRWHQRWFDSSGAIVDFDGGAVGGAIVLTGNWRNVVGPGQDALVRMSYSRNADGSVRQLGVQSVDEGISWQPSFDFTYRPHAAH